MQHVTDQIIVDIIRQEMALGASNVVIRDQNFKIPADDGIYVMVGMVDAFPFSAQTYMETQPVPDTDPVEYQQVEVDRVLVRENIQIDVFSRSNAAITRRWEVLAALRSIYAIQRQESEEFKIARIPTSFVNSSSAEGGSQLNRYSLIFPCLVWYKKSKSLASDGGKYYDDFNTRVDDAISITTEKGLIEFNIKGENIT